MQLHVINNILDRKIEQKFDTNRNHLNIRLASLIIKRLGLMNIDKLYKLEEDGLTLTNFNPRVALFNSNSSETLVAPK